MMIDVPVLESALQKSGSSFDGKLDSQKTFVNNGVDSLDVFSMLSTIEEDYGVSVTDDELVEATTPDLMLKLLNSKLA